TGGRRACSGLIGHLRGLHILPSPLAGGGRNEGGRATSVWWAAAAGRAAAQSRFNTSYRTNLFGLGVRHNITARPLSMDVAMKDTRKLRQPLADADWLPDTDVPKSPLERGLTPN